MTVHTNTLVDEYLRRLDAAAAGLPPHRRDELVTEIRDHLEEALRRTPTSDEVAVRNLLERLGPPEDIVEAATDSPPSDQLFGAVRETNSSAIASLLLGLFWFAGIGSVLAIIFGYRARREIKNSGGSQKGSALATVGIVLGWIGIAMLLAAVVGGLSLIASGVSVGPATVVGTP
jgi:uncharacterized membrane protein